MIIGIDLSGPANHSHTALAILDQKHIKIHSNLSDMDIYKIVKQQGAQDIKICIDAPLSYSETGGLRPSDRALSTLLKERGFSHIGVMAPTFNRMIYLTARGIRLSRLLDSFDNTQIIESHPGAFLALSGYNYKQLREVKTSKSSLNALTDTIKSSYQLNQMDYLIQL